MWHFFNSQAAEIRGEKREIQKENVEIDRFTIFLNYSTHPFIKNQMTTYYS